MSIRLEGTALLGRSPRVRKVSNVPIYLLVTGKVQQKMKKQFSALLFSRGLSSLIQAVSLLLFIRWAGIEAFGVIAVITSIAAVLYTLADWGATIHIPRSRAKQQSQLVAGGLAVSIIGNSIDRKSVV